MEEFDREFGGKNFLQKNIVIIVVIAVLVVLGYFFFNGWDKAVNTEIDGMTTITGHFSCLPLKDIEAEITDCSLGIRAKNGSYYALNVSRVQDANIDLKAEDTIAVTGTIEPDETRLEDRWAPYDIAGVIKVNTLLRTR